MLYSLTIEKLHGSEPWISVIRAGGLTEIAAPDGVMLFHQGDLVRGKLALALCNSREAILTLTTQNTRRTSAETGSAALTRYDLPRLISSLNHRVKVGHKITDKDEAAVFFIKDKSVFACFT